GKASGRREPCYIGSIKTNLGHMESAAGMGGLIKLALVLSRREVFPHLLFRRPNPKIDFDDLGLRVATERVDLAKEGSLFGGVNSFGFGGATPHAVLESPPAPVLTKRSRPIVMTEAAASPMVFALSARSPSAL